MNYLLITHLVMNFQGTVVIPEPFMFFLMPKSICRRNNGCFHLKLSKFCHFNWNDENSIVVHQRIYEHIHLALILRISLKLLDQWMRWGIIVYCSCACPKFHCSYASYLINSDILFIQLLYFVCSFSCEFSHHKNSSEVIYFHHMSSNRNRVIVINYNRLQIYCNRSRNHKF